ncbi:MAG: hypothetical protein QG635_151 [Bacteroidota bacterium]|nr:hypothetical protein [Bacteroidota bacterium]
MIIESKYKYGSILRSCSYFYLVLLAGMIISIVLSGAPSDTDALSKFIHENTLRYSLGFVFASLISLPISTIFIILAYYIIDEAGNSLKSLLVVTFLIPYIVFSTFAYTSQYILLPALLSSSITIENRLINLMIFESSFSIPKYLDFIGYAFWGLSSFILGLKMLNSTGTGKIIAWLLIICGITAEGGVIGMALSSKIIIFLNTFSGALTIPLIVLIIIYSVRLDRLNNKMEADNE